MAWWIWVLGGVALLVVELLTPGSFFALFFGVGAIAVGGLELAGLGGPGWLQWVLWSVLSLALLIGVRRRLRGVLTSRGPRVHDLVGETAVLLDDLPPRGVVRAELRGIPWDARSDSQEPIRRGQRCRVERVDGLTLWVRPE
jgi:membrane protein implicated in regulation of membrane protease activity